MFCAGAGCYFNRGWRKKGVPKQLEGKDKSKGDPLLNLQQLFEYNTVLCVC